MFYVIERKPVQLSHLICRMHDLDEIAICTRPAKTYDPDEDYMLESELGEYVSAELAEAAIAAALDGKLRRHDPFGRRFVSGDSSVVVTYRPGKYTPLGVDATVDHVISDVIERVTADMTRRDMRRLAGQLEQAANDEGWTLADNLLDLIEGRCEFLRLWRGD